ncbi:uncharacterized protein LOC118739951 [Rhagoletis pomonella]|uniref:uncharacterized protein LOC118739951 n=1 Tax=Rhagoletis pomonella TaxID=28610 RepID=UPI001782EF27|nr:uncharacterized protein LOC118739951 [Rhagoletis pomonella]
MGKVEWTSTMIVRLIKEAKERPCLWNKTDSQFANKIYKTIAYEEIGDILGVPGENVRMKLRNLRINFMQVHKKQLKASLNAKRVYPPKWEYYDALLFMAESCVPVEGTPSKRSKRAVEYEESSTSFDPLMDEVSRTDEIYKTEDLNEEDECYNSEDLNRTEKCNNSEDFNNSADCNRRNESNRINEPIISQEKARVNKGSNEIFGEYVAASLNCLDDAKFVKRMKAKIQLSISEVMTENAMQKLSECDSSAEL